MIRQLKSILLVIRGRSEEEAAIRRAVRLAKESRCRLTALRVLRNLPPDLRMLGAIVPVETLKKAAIDEAHKDLEAILAPAKKQGSKIQIKITWGTPYLEVIREVLRKKHSLVILSASTKSALRTRLLGSMTMQLMRNCPCPIWVVKTAQRAPYSRVLMALGPEFESEDAARLNQKILDWASSLTALENSELHAGHAWDLFAESVLHGRAGVQPTDVARMSRQARKLQKEWLARLLGPYDLAKHPERIHLVKGSAAVAIPRLVQRERIDLLVMGTVCRTGIPGFLIGNTAERILNQVDCSVLTLKPDRFTTPVKLP
jgi:nucleotide-binding universal stress UspA family protein